MRASPRAARWQACIATVGMIAVAGVAVSAVQARHGAAVTGEVAYTRYWEDPQLRYTWITAADLAGRGRHEITQRPGKGEFLDDSGPAWSPDGLQVAFLRRGRTSLGLYLANRDGTGLRRVLRVPRRKGDDYLGAARAYSWSPDGRRLAFANGPLYVVNRDGTNNRRLLASATCKPSWSPDGKSLVYLADDSCAEREFSDWSPQRGHRAVYRIDADGTHRRQLASGSFGDASWSPDGRQIAFTDDCSFDHAGEVFCSVSLMKVDGSGKRRLVIAPRFTNDGWVEWAAGGTEVLWSAYPAVQATNVATGRTHRVTLGTPVGISEDGATIAIRTWGSDSLVVVTVDGRVLQRVTVPRGWQYDEVSVYLG